MNRFKMNRFKIWIKTLYYHILSWKCCKYSTLLSIDETIKEIKYKNKSLIRYGDGEFIIMSGGDIHYQCSDKVLEEKLNNIIKEYLINPQKSPYLLCMPTPFISCNGMKLSKRRVWVSSWARARYYYKKNLDLRDIYYGDAFLFSKTYEASYEKIWSNSDSIIFLHNNKKFAENFTAKYGIKTTFIKVPSNNSFAEVDKLLDKILVAIDKDTSINKLVLISAGPCAKVLVYELSKRGIKAIDTGHCWDDPLEVIEN